MCETDAPLLASCVARGAGLNVPKHVAGKKQHITHKQNTEPGVAKRNFDMVRSE